MKRRMVLSLLLFSTIASQAAESRRIAFEVSEAAGIRRRSDVVSAQFNLARIPAESGFRLLRGGKPINAQFRKVESENGQPLLAIDFIDHFGPFEKRRYEIEYGRGVTSKERPPGLRLKETEADFQINSAGVVDWTVRRDLSGLLDFKWKQRPYVAPNSVGLFFMQEGKLQRLASRKPTEVRVQRQGPVATALRFDYENWPPGAGSRVTLEFVRTKSWVRVEWIISGDGARLSGIGAELNLLLEGREAMLDFGAGDFVYTTVRRGERSLLEAGPSSRGNTPWRVLKGPADAPQPIAVASKRIKTPRVPGWAHAMDAERCTAIAVGEFARASVDRIEVAGDGRLRVERGLSDGKQQTKRLEFWVHFVTMPVHIGARTSPRSMQEPLVVKELK